MVFTIFLVFLIFLWFSHGFPMFFPDGARFVSDSGRLSVEFDEEASHPVEANEAVDDGW